jgi:hypothetical protein
MTLAEDSELAATLEGVDKLGEVDRGLFRDLIVTHPQTAKTYRQLRDAVQDAGIGEEVTGRESLALALNLEVDRMVEAEDWENPAELFEPDHGFELKPEEMTSILDGRLDRGEIASGKHAEICAKLRRAAGDEGAGL